MPAARAIPPRSLLALLLSSLACAAAIPAARADMYTWTDASGRVNVSNLAPPEGAHVTNVKREVAPPTPPPDPVREAARAAERERELQALADRAHQLEMQALAERVRDLERQVENAQYAQQRRVPFTSPVDYGAPQAFQYVSDAPQMNGGCDPSWAGCWWNPGFYGGGVVVVGVPSYRRHPAWSAGGGPRFGPTRPVRGGGGGGGGPPPRRR